MILSSQSHNKNYSRRWKVGKQITVTANSMLIDISTLAKGMYIQQYNNDVKTEQVKIIKL